MNWTDRVLRQCYFGTSQIWAREKKERNNCKEKNKRVLKVNEGNLRLSHNHMGGGGGPRKSSGRVPHRGTRGY